MNTEAPPPEPHPERDAAFDVVVVGGGGAGLVAAVRCAELTRKRVLVLEKSSRCGGNTNLGHLFTIRNSRMHRAAGYPDRREEHAERLFRAGKGELDRELVYRATYALSDMFDWLCETSDIERYCRLTPFEKGSMMSEASSWGAEAFVDFPKRTLNVKSTDHSMGPGWMGSYVIQAMLRRCRELGVTVWTEHRAAELLTDERGVFQGLLAADPGGKTRVRARACLLASGGFSNSRELVDRVRPGFYQGYPTHTFTVASCTGDAIGMVEAIGGKIDWEHIKIPMFGPTHHPYPFSSVMMARQPEMVYINLTGARFCDESTCCRPSMECDIMEQQPGKAGYAVMDSRTAEYLGNRLVRESGDAEYRRCMEPWRAQLEEECGWDRAAQKADTLEELADRMGVDRAAFAAEMARYNQFCAEGRDLEFGKPSQALRPIQTPPFYALFLARFNEGAEGGVVNDAHLRVLRTDGTPFSGLYAAGDCCRGLLKREDEGGKFGEMAWAMASGYMAGQELAGYLEGEA